MKGVREYVPMPRLAWWPLLLLLSGTMLAAVSGYAAPRVSAYLVCQGATARPTIRGAHERSRNVHPSLLNDDATDDDVDGDESFQASTSVVTLPRHLPPSEGPAAAFEVSAVRLREHRRLVERPPTA